MPTEVSRSRVAAGDDLDAHLIEFLAALARHGYTGSTQDRKKRLIVPFIRWVRRTGIDLADLEEASVDAFLTRCSRRASDYRAAIGQFLAYVREVGAVPPCRSQHSSGEALVSRYAEHLRGTQGLSPHSIAAYAPFVRAFVLARHLPDDAKALDRVAVGRYQVEQSRNRSVSFVRLMAAALRSFLRFCFLDDITAGDLSIAVSPIRRWQHATIPAFLTAEEIEHVIAVAAAQRSTARGCRDFAILLLLARLGLRASEILALALDDIRWDTGEIVVRGKGRIHDRLPLPHEVGEALALYLSGARGPASARSVFLRHIAPRSGLLQPAGISKIARQALKRAGLLPLGRVGAHIFRHSLATRMIRGGASITEISQALRHRSTSTTQLYAKVELDGLRAVTLPWPSAGATR